MVSTRSASRISSGVRRVARWSWREIPISDMTWMDFPGSLFAGKSRNPGRRYLDFPLTPFLQYFARQGAGHTAAASVAGAHKKNFHRSFHLPISKFQEKLILNLNIEIMNSCKVMRKS